MIVIDYGDKLREAFAAGRAAANARLGLMKITDPTTRKFLEGVPQTYDDWIASKANKPSVARG